MWTPTNTKRFKFYSVLLKKQARPDYPFPYSFSKCQRPTIAIYSNYLNPNIYHMHREIRHMSYGAGAPGNLPSPFQLYAPKPPVSSLFVCILCRLFVALCLRLCNDEYSPSCWQCVFRTPEPPGIVAKATRIDDKTPNMSPAI